VEASVVGVLSVVSAVAEGEVPSGFGSSIVEPVDDELLDGSGGADVSPARSFDVHDASSRAATRHTRGACGMAAT
jgi:hypothetical protein